MVRGNDECHGDQWGECRWGGYHTPDAVPNPLQPIHVRSSCHGSWDDGRGRSFTSAAPRLLNFFFANFFSLQQQYPNLRK